MDFLSARNLTWTSQPPEGDGLKRMGVETKNFAKNIGSAVIGGAGGIAVVQSIGPIASGLGAMFEGGEKSLHEQVKGLRKKYKNSL